MALKHVGITGADGTIGSILRQGLEGEYRIKAFTLGPSEFESTQVDLSDPTAVEGAFARLDAVIHLAADPSPSAAWESVRENNIEATFQVFEECRRSGVKRLIFATTNHTQHGNTILTTPETLDAKKNIRMKLDDPPNPDSLYAISKLFGEHMGKLYSERYGLEFVGLRIGWITRENNPELKRNTRSEQYMRAMYLSHRDGIQAFRRALEVETRYLLAYAVSNNDRLVFDLEQTREKLGFEPRDNAETFFNDIG